MNQQTSVPKLEAQADTGVASIYVAGNPEAW